MQKTKEIQPETLKKAIEIITPRGFDAAFFALLNKKNCTHIEAYEELEAIYKQVFGIRRYASIDSYRISRNRRLKNI